MSVSSILSDHFCININVSLQKQSVSNRVISNRKYKSIDKEVFFADLQISFLVLNPADDVDHLVDFHDMTLSDIIDDHAPIRTKERSRRPKCPW